MQAADDPASNDPARELWKFATSFYGREGVAAACLLLQDRLAVNVNILLLSLYALLERGVSLKSDDLSAARGLVDDWDREIVQGLRHLRRRLKSGPSPAPSPATVELRDNIKSIELQAERIELAMLGDWLVRRRAQPIATATEDADAVLFRVALCFSGRCEVSLGDPDIRAALENLALATDAARRETVLSDRSQLEGT
jgi:uncharacterized protein (TIGR02444 family)